MMSLTSGVPRILEWKGSRSPRRRGGGGEVRCVDCGGVSPPHWGRVWGGGTAALSPENFSYFFVENAIF